MCRTWPSCRPFTSVNVVLLFFLLECLGVAQVSQSVPTCASLAQQFEVAITGHSRGTEIVLDNKHRHGSIPGNHNRPDYTRLGEYHMIALGAHAAKTIGLEDFDELLIRNRAKLWHAPVEAGESRAAH